jgi:hypothetical protein
MEEEKSPFFSVDSVDSGGSVPPVIHVNTELFQAQLSLYVLEPPGLALKE